MQVIDQKDISAVDVAISFLKQGKVICFATDTVYGLAVDATNARAVDNLYRLKNRNKNKPIAVFLSNKTQVSKFFKTSYVADLIINKYTPGAITIILETTKYAQKKLAKNLNNNHNKFIGFRIVDSFFIRKLFAKYDGILAVSSANKSNEEACSSPQAIKKNLKDLDLLICGKKTSKISSTIVKIQSEKISIVRQGKLIIQEYEYQ
ncbi:MAG: threonylcarbamoyl-AMP synthase [Proteobacteria bacterium]|nr:threonylcarbamoyl-AMP synthase [Pseudomonadota bacterium]NCA27789.1 threonylcarbamoyl-AMP synthase [Pseudomonadota bacterium]